MLKALDLTLMAMNAALYAAIGYLVYFIFPVVAPTIGGVRFWPVVVIPATFALLFGPIVGGGGAAIGIFISDMLIHGDPLLSLTAGVTSNLVCFGLIGYLSHKKLDWKKTFLSLTIGIVVLATLVYLIITPETLINYFSTPTHVLTSSEAAWNVYFVLAILAISCTLVVAIGYVRPKWRSFGTASVVGSVIGSAIIGVGVWGYTQFFSLPTAIGGARNLPYYAGLILFAWTFATEIPFMVILVPPIGEACYRAFPSLRPKQE
jgi:uncharacterized membrane protein